MDIMMQLKGPAFSTMAVEFKTREKELAGGLPLLEFVKIMLHGLPKPNNTQDFANTVGKLIDLFNDIDINGDGSLEFDEFTSYCVDAGMVATRVKHAPLKYKYVKKEVEFEKSGTTSPIHSMKWFPMIKMLFVIECQSKCLKLYSQDLKIVGEIYPSKKIFISISSSVLGTQKLKVLDMRENKNGGASVSTGSNGSDSSNKALSGNDEIEAFVLDAIYIPDYNWIAVSSSDFAILFIDMETWKILCHVHLQVAQTTVRWCTVSQLFFSSGNNAVLNTFKILPSGQLQNQQEFKVVSWKGLTQHKDIIMDVLEIPLHDVIASCDLSHQILLWDIQDCRTRGKLVGHTRGVRQLVFSESNDLLLSIGFEFDGFGWDVSSKQIILKLIGHRFPLVGISLVQFHKECAVTADEEGNFKLWNILRTNGSAAQILENFASHSQSALSIFRPRAFVIVSPRKDIVAGGSKLYMFESKKIQQYEEIPIRAFYHQTSNKFLCISGQSVSVYNGQNGDMCDEFYNILKQSNDVVCCCQDANNKKAILVSESGKIQVFNCANLTCIRETKVGIGSIATVMYNTKDKVIIAAKYDSSIHIFDDQSVGECLPLRRLSNCHEPGIITAAFSYNASLIATASSDMTIRLWDFETLKLHAICVTSVSEMHCLEFLEPFPVVISADSSGNILFWATSPQYTCNVGGCLHAVKNKNQSNSKLDVPTFITDESDENCKVVSFMKPFYDSTNGNHILFTGDESGTIRCWGLQKMINRLKLRAIPKEKLKWNRRGYNPRAEAVYRHGNDNSVLKNNVPAELHHLHDIHNGVSANVSHKNENQHHHVMEKGKRDKRESLAISRKVKNSPTNIPPHIIKERKKSNFVSTIKFAEKDLHVPPPTTHASCWIPCDVVAIESWQAHRDAINSLDIHQSPDIVVSCSFDYTVKIWSWKGEKLGQIGNGGEFFTQRWKFAENKLYREAERNSIIKTLLKELDTSAFSGQSMKHKELQLSALNESDEFVDKVSTSSNYRKKSSFIGNNNPLLEHMLNNRNTLQMNKTLTKTDAISEHQDLVLYPFTLESNDIQKHELEYNLGDSVKHNKQRRLTSLGQVGPLIRKSSILGQDNNTIETDPMIPDVEMNTLDNLPAQTSNVVNPNLEKKQYFQNKAAFMYENYSFVLKDRKHKNKISKQKKMDISLSSFLKERLGTASDVVHPNRMENKVRPHTAPDSIQGANTMRNSRSERSIAYQPVDSTKTNKKYLSPIHSRNNSFSKDTLGVKRRSSQNLVNDTQSELADLPASLIKSVSCVDLKKSTKSQKKLDGINSIISSANAVENFETPGKDIDENQLRQNMVAAKNKFDKLVEPDVVVKKKNKLSLSIERCKQRKEKRLKEYMDQKKRAVNRNVGAVLRNTSLLYCSSPVEEQNLPADKKIAGNSNIDQQLGGGVARYGIYSVKEVMAVVRLFWSLDKDISGTISLNEIVGSDILANSVHMNLASIFQSIDLDGSGEISLAELLTVCFTYATMGQIQDMVKLAKVGQVQHIVSGEPTSLTPEQRSEMQDIFNVFDKDGSGDVSLQEVLEVLQVDEANNNGESNALGLTVDDIEYFYKQYDTNGDQQLNLDEFIVMLREIYDRVPTNT